jgi:predicted RNase H-like HicB family nuclease
MNLKYAVIIESTSEGIGAYVPDLPGCVAAGETKEEVISLIHQAIEFHLSGLREEGLAIPTPASSVEFVEVAA